MPIELPKRIQFHGLGVAIEEAHINRTRQWCGRRPVTGHGSWPVAVTWNVQTAHAKAEARRVHAVIAFVKIHSRDIYGCGARDVTGAVSEQWGGDWLDYLPLSRETLESWEEQPGIDRVAGGSQIGDGTPMIIPRCLYISEACACCLCRRARTYPAPVEPDLRAR